MSGTTTFCSNSSRRDGHCFTTGIEMASKRKVNLDTLEALGAKRLAALLMDLAEDDAAINRRLRLELAAKEAPESVAAELRKRLAQIARARSFIDWRKIRELAADLEMQ